MQRQSVIDVLLANKSQLRDAGVATLFLFGSTATDEARTDSDVDLFFDYRDSNFSLIELVKVRDQIASILGVEADVMTRDSIHPRLRTRIESSAIQVF